MKKTSATYIQPPQMESNLFHPGARRLFTATLEALEQSRSEWIGDVGTAAAQAPSRASARITGALSYLPAEKYESLWEWKRGSEAETILFVALLNTGKLTIELVHKVAQEAAYITTRIAATRALTKYYEDYLSNAETDGTFHKP